MVIKCSHLIAKWPKYLKDSLSLQKILKFERTQINATFCCLFGRVAMKGVLGLFPAFAGFVQLCYHGDMSWFAIMLLSVYVMFHNSVLK